MNALRAEFGMHVTRSNVIITAIVLRYVNNSLWKLPKLSLNQKTYVRSLSDTSGGGKRQQLFLLQEVLAQVCKSIAVTISAVSVYITQLLLLLQCHLSKEQSKLSP